jgi:vacuolar-type H+-ATPase subunit F/Vma7
MSSVVAIGGPDSIEGFALAGAIVKIAVEPDAVRRAWDDLDDDVGLVVLSATAAEVLGDARQDRQSTLTVVMPA